MKVAALILLLLPSMCVAAEPPRIPRIIYFGASWCAPCRDALHGKDNFPDWLTPEGWRINGSDQAHIQVVDIDERDDLMEQYRVKMVPCMVIVTDKGGSEPIPYTGRASIAAAIKRAWK